MCALSGCSCHRGEAPLAPAGKASGPENTACSEKAAPAGRLPGTPDGRWVKRAPHGLGSRACGSCRISGAARPHRLPPGRAGPGPGAVAGAPPKAEGLQRDRPRRAAARADEAQRAEAQGAGVLGFLQPAPRAAGAEGSGRRAPHPAGTHWPGSGRRAAGRGGTVAGLQDVNCVAHRAGKARRPPRKAALTVPKDAVGGARPQALASPGPAWDAAGTRSPAGLRRRARARPRPASRTARPAPRRPRPAPRTAPPRPT
nr:uncharacterized protein LOC111770146 [Equus caballus]